MSWRRRYGYIEATYAPPGEKFERWRRMEERMLEQEVIRPSGNHNVFATIQRFRNPVEEEGEAHWSDLLFDLDGDLDEAKDDAARVVDFFTQAPLSVDEKNVRVWFSGHKGFHIIVNGEALGVEPDPDLHRIHKLAALAVEQLLNIKTLDSASIYGRKRMLRIPNTIHPQSRLYKVELTRGQLDLSIEDLRRLAKSPGPVRPWEEDVRPSEQAAAWFRQWIKQYEDFRMLHRVRPQTVIMRSDTPPVCVLDLMNNHIRKPGSRNQATLTLATYYKDQGRGQEETEDILVEWARRTPPELTGTQDARTLEINTRSVVRAVYSDPDRYVFACSYMRNLGSGAEPIQCAFDGCELLMQEEKEVVDCHLAESSGPLLVHKRLRIGVLVSGKDTAPFLAGSRYRAFCTPNEREGSRCLGCRLYVSGGQAEASFNEKTRDILKFIDAPDRMVAAAVKQALRIPQRCSSFSYEVLEYVNVEEVRLIPRNENALREQEYVVRKGYHIHQGGQSLKTNQEYDIVAYPTPDPRSKYAVLAFNEATGSESSLDAFQLAEEQKRMLTIFQPASMTVEEKMRDIHHDLEHNVTRIWGRTTVAQALDLVYHSAIGFRFQREIQHRGWLQLLIIGDTREGKSQLVERIMTHYDLGHKISGETASRTGLVYNLQESSGRWFLAWGVIPMNDRRLVVIDEFGGLDENEIALMSDLRSTGVAEVRRVISAQTNARTRLVFISNPRAGVEMTEYTFGITAVKHLMGKNEDIARLDLVVAVPSGEVPPEIMNQDINVMEAVEHRYTGGLCHLLLLWVWTRHPDQVVFTPEAEVIILDLAVKLAAVYECDIPLANTADLRIKLARLSAAVAGRLFSTEDGETLIVRPEHVVYAADFLRELYRSPGVRLEQYATKRQGPVLDMPKLLAEMASIVHQDWRKVLGSLMFNDYMTLSSLEQELGMEREEARALLAWLSQHQMVRKTARYYYRKTEVGNRFLHWAQDQPDPDQGKAF